MALTRCNTTSMMTPQASVTFVNSTTGTKSNGDLIDSAPDGIKRAFTGQPITGSSLSGRNIVTESSEVSCGDRKHYLDVRRFEQNVTDFCDLYAKLGKMPPYDTPQYKDYKIRQTNQAHPKDNGNHLILTRQSYFSPFLM